MKPGSPCWWFIPACGYILGRADGSYVGLCGYLVSHLGSQYVHTIGSRVITSNLSARAAEHVASALRFKDVLKDVSQHIYACLCTPWPLEADPTSSVYLHACTLHSLSGLDRSEIHASVI